ncbi:LOW QUALITY PROTEIN: ATP-binding cassette sub-family C member 8-like [Pollicipes pollicipes]|uniref:LOW QUALITY PROTEIN: ATP-binding cassette sub-family C member 8-like n=1 Tax=Pollicipes pollicipes TaxID=41117 RepID=UPI001884BF3C|nr:LOW QUALITY PROTEIN: ATP-binding cassette sub-family C member 8-like [Pollicipes pollicipes]
MESLCGRPGPLAWDDVCHLDLAAAAVALAHVTACVVGALLWRCRPAAAPVRFRRHGARWALALLCALLALAQLMDASLGEWYASVVHVHVLAAPAAALLAAGSVIWLATVSERDAAPVRLLLNVAYLAMAVTLGVLKVRFYSGVAGLGADHMRLDLAWALLVAYGLMLGVEVHFAISERYVCGTSRLYSLTPEKENVDNVVYKHPHASALQKVTFSWIFNLLLVGFQTPIEFTDLGSLPSGEDTLPHYEKLSKSLKREKAQAAGAGREVRLWRVMWRTHRRRLLLGGLLKLCGDLSGFVAPLALKNIIEFVMLHQSGELQVHHLESAGQESALECGPTLGSRSTQDGQRNTPAALTCARSHACPTLARNGLPASPFTRISVCPQYLYPTVADFLSNGYVMSVLALVAALAQGTFSQSCTHVMVTEGERLRAEVQALVYEKSLKIPTAGTDHATTDKSDTLQRPAGGEGIGETGHNDHVDSGNIISLLSEDAANLSELICQSQYIWAIPLKIIILLVLIHGQLGISAVIGCFVSIFLLTPLQFVIVKNLQANKHVLQAKSDERLSRSIEFVNGIRQLKLNALEFAYEKKIQLVRKNELKLLMKDSLFWALNMFLTQASLTVITMTTFGLYSLLERQPLVSSHVFSGVALFNQLTVPLFVLPKIVKAIIGAWVSIGRLGDFLGLAEVESLRRQSPVSGDAGASRATLQGPTPSLSTTTTGSRSPETTERPDSLDLSPPEGPACLWGSQDSVFGLQSIPEADEEVDAAAVAGAVAAAVSNRLAADGQPRASRMAAGDAAAQTDDVPNGGPPQGNGTEDDATDVPPPTFFASASASDPATDRQEPGRNRPVRVLQPLNLQAVRFAVDPVEPDMDPDGEPAAAREAPVVRVEQACFSWRPDGEADTLADISLVVPRGRLTMIVGPVGSGKSSLVAALLGELRRKSGSVTWASSAPLAYASQSPWLFNDSLRNNVLFGRGMNPRRYRRVLAACALDEDIILLGPAGDSTVIGEQGVVLSGGQRQRVAVARALYSNVNCVILDDPLSALDVHVGLHVFENGIRKLLVQQGRTVILVTHKLQYLKHADQVVALERGRVRQQGTLAQIAEADPELYRRWQQLIQLNQQQENQEAAAETRTARERWRLLQKIQKASRLMTAAPAVSRDKFSSFRRAALGRRSSLRHHMSHGLPVPLDVGSDDYGAVPRVRRRLYRRSSSLGPQAPGAPSQPSTPDTPAEDAERRYESLRLQRMVSSPPNMPSPLVPARGSVSDSGRQLLNLLLRRSTTSSRTSPVDPERDVPPEQMAPLVPADPPPPPRPQLTRALSIASNYSEMYRDEEEESDLDSRRFLDEDREKGKISKLVYITYMRACGLGFGILYLTMVLLTQGAHVGTDVWLSRWSEAASRWNRSHKDQWQQLAGGNATPASAVESEDVSDAYEAFMASETRSYLLVYGVLSAVAVLLALAANLSGQWAGARGRRSLQRRLLAAVTRARKEFFDRTPAGRIIDRFAQDVSFIDKKLATEIHMLLFFVLQCLTAVIVNVVVTWWFIFIALFITVIYYFLQRFYRTFAIELQRLDTIARAPVLSHLAETQAGLSVVRAYGHQKRFFRTLLQCVDLHLLTSLVYESGQRWLGIALDYLGAVIVFVSKRVGRDSGRHQPGARAVGSHRPGHQLHLLIPTYLVWGCGACIGRALKARSSSPRALGYSGEDTAIVRVLKDVSVTILPGQKVALVGRSGSGKSTLAMALFQMSDLLEGVIRIDGMDLKSVPLHSIRSQVALIPQEPLLVC